MKMTAKEQRAILKIQISTKDFFFERCSFQYHYDMGYKITSVSIIITCKTIHHTMKPYFFEGKNINECIEKLITTLNEKI